MPHFLKRGEKSMAEEIGGTKEELKAAKTSPAKRALTSAQLRKALADRKDIVGKLKTNIINKAKELGISSEIALKKLVTQMVNLSAKGHKVVDEKLFGKDKMNWPRLQSMEWIKSGGAPKRGGGKVHMKKYAKGGGMRKAMYK